MDIAERNGSALRRVLASAESLRDCAIALGSFQVKTPFSRLSALLSRVTLADHLLFGVEPDFSAIVRSQFSIPGLLGFLFYNFINVIVFFSKTISRYMISANGLT